MENPTHEQLIAALGGMPPNMHPVPSEAQKRELLKVQGMQVRTNAIGLAVNLLQHRQTSEATLIKRARAIERYIMGEGEVADTAPPLLPRA